MQMFKKEVIGVDYLTRYILVRSRWLSIYVHKFTGSDDDRALHDRPADSVSIILRGAYVEHMRNKKRFVRWPGCFVRRRAETPHRIELVNNKPVWTLFLFGRRRRPWGFHCPKGWVHWRDFTDATGLKRGKGCGEE